MHVRYRRWSGALEPNSVEKELTINVMHIEGRWEHCSLTPGNTLGISSVDYLNIRASLHITKQFENFKVCFLSSIEDSYCPWHPLSLM